MQADRMNVSRTLDEHILATKDLTPAQKIIWRYLYCQSYLNKNLSCKVTSKQIAEGTNHKAVSIRKIIRGLEEKGYVFTNMDSSTSINIFYLTLPAYALRKIQQAGLSKKAVT